MEVMAWLVLRIVFACFFLYPIKGLLADWQGTKKMVSVLVPFWIPFFSIATIATMLIGAFLILFGFYGQIGGFILLVYCLIGALLHYRLGNLCKTYTLSALANLDDKATLEAAATLGRIGHITSAQKNLVLAAIALFFTLLGTGPMSLTVPF